MKFKKKLRESEDSTIKKKKKTFRIKSNNNFDTFFNQISNICRSLV